MIGTLLLTPNLAWTPVFEPLPGIERWWWLMAVPIVALLSLGYKAAALGSLGRVYRETLIMTLQLLGGLIVLGLMVHIGLAILR